MIRPRRRPLPLLAQRRAVAALELALVFAPLMIFVLGIFSVGLSFYIQQTLDYSVQSAARQVQIGKVPSTYTASDFTSKVLCPFFGAFQTCANMYVDLHPVADYETLVAMHGADAPDSSGTGGFTFCSGKPGQLMYAHVVYFAPSIGGALLGASGGLSPVVANAAFSNENPSGAPVVAANGC